LVGSKIYISLKKLQQKCWSFFLCSILKKNIRCLSIWL